AFRNRMYRTEKRPEYDPRLYRCLEGYIELNGMRVFALFDSGSTFDSITPSVAMQIKADEFQFPRSVKVQLATKGSHTALARGTYAQCRFGPVDTTHYFDISNIDHYDCVLGMPFLAKHDVVLRPRNRLIEVGEKFSMPAIEEGARLKSWSQTQRPTGSAPKTATK
ncbi:hypothetical protein K474DRAFT_1583413, partial [Panus rudis PR-1116 ss-1]